jgi:hypothetical protein
MMYFREGRSVPIPLADTVGDERWHDVRKPDHTLSGELSSSSHLTCGFQRGYMDTPIIRACHDVISRHQR